MLKLLDRTYYRFVEAARSFAKPDRTNESYDRGLSNGVEVGFAKVRQVLDATDPYQFQNQHFRLGYYYASDSVKKVIANDEDNAMA